MKLSSTSFISLVVLIACQTATNSSAFLIVPNNRNKTYKLAARRKNDFKLQSLKVQHGTECHTEDWCRQLSTTTTTTTNTTRDSFLSTMVATFGTILMMPPPAMAAYGDSSNIELPNYIDFLIEKNTTPDQSKILYKGSDIDVQIKRISDAATRLNDIPKFAGEKKWSQVQGILTGPLGTLVQTMNTLCRDTNGSETAKNAAAKVKGDIILISQQAAKKNEDGVISACDMAKNDLEAFVKLVF